jgi:hypothetical protein
MVRADMGASLYSGPGEDSRRFNTTPLRKIYRHRSAKKTPKSPGVAPKSGRPTGLLIAIPCLGLRFAVPESFLASLPGSAEKTSLNNSTVMRPLSGGLVNAIESWDLRAIPFDGDISHSHLIPCVYHERRYQGGCDEDARGMVFVADR